MTKNKHISIKIEATHIFDAFILTPRVIVDNRGFFFESWNEKTFQEVVGLETSFVQDNHSRSKRGVLRGLHYQLHFPQGKLVRVIQGRVFDVAVDLRESSPTFGKYVGVELSDENHKQLWIPPGCAHGFFVQSESADFVYKTTDYYKSDDEYCIRWDDPDLNINWRLDNITPQLSAKDSKGQAFQDAPKYY